MAALGAVAIVVFGDAGQTVIGLQFQKRKIAPARAAMQGFTAGDFHCLILIHGRLDFCWRSLANDCLVTARICFAGQ
jgi:hypothetical protein